MSVSAWVRVLHLNVSVTSDFATPCFPEFIYWSGNTPTPSPLNCFQMSKHLTKHWLSSRRAQWISSYVSGVTWSPPKTEVKLWPSPCSSILIFNFRKMKERCLFRWSKKSGQASADFSLKAEKWTSLFLLPAHSGWHDIWGEEAM